MTLQRLSLSRSCNHVSVAAVPSCCLFSIPQGGLHSHLSKGVCLNFRALTPLGESVSSCTRFQMHSVRFFHGLLNTEYRRGFNPEGLSKVTAWLQQVGSKLDSTGFLFLSVITKSPKRPALPAQPPTSGRRPKASHIRILGRSGRSSETGRLQSAMSTSKNVFERFSRSTPASRVSVNPYALPVPTFELPDFKALAMCSWEPNLGHTSTTGPSNRTKCSLSPCIFLWTRFCAM